MYLLWYGAKSYVMVWFNAPYFCSLIPYLSTFTTVWGVGTCDPRGQPAGLSEWCGASTLRHASVALLIGRRAFGHDIRWQESPRCDGLVWGGLDDGAPEKDDLGEQFSYMWYINVQSLYTVFLVLCTFFLFISYSIMSAYQYIHLYSRKFSERQKTGRATKHPDVACANMSQVLSQSTSPFRIVRSRGILVWTLQTWKVETYCTLQGTVPYPLSVGMFDRWDMLVPRSVNDEISFPSLFCWAVFCFSLTNVLVV